MTPRLVPPQRRSSVSGRRRSRNKHQIAMRSSTDPGRTPNSNQLVNSFHACALQLKQNNRGAWLQVSTIFNIYTFNRFIVVLNYVSRLIHRYLRERASTTAGRPRWRINHTPISTRRASNDDNATRVLMHASPVPILLCWLASMNMKSN
jgi:hypothetical protein